MAVSQSFVDLRSSSLSAGSHTDDSVWPSFTDIMTVVVMIFLMSLVVILLRNVELVKSEQESTRIAELKASENIELESAISNLEQRIARIQLQLQAQILKTGQNAEQLEQSQQQVTLLMANIQALQLLRNKLSDENTRLAATRLALEGRLKVVEDEKIQIDQLKQKTEQTKLVLENENQQLLVQLKATLDEQQELEAALVQQKSSLESLKQEKLTFATQAKQSGDDFDALKAVYSILQQDNRSLFDRISQAEKMIAELEENLSAASQTIEHKQQQLLTAESEVLSKSEELVETQEQITALERKYLELVGPARSELNKYVVRIRYRRLGNQQIIELGMPDNPQLTQITESDLHHRLAQLKRQKADELYTKVIIPPDSGLSYDQAWRFTQDILTQYDYYYQ